MKTLKSILIVIGGIGLCVGLYLTIKLAVEMPDLVEAANAGRTGSGLFNSPMPSVWLAAGVCLLCGLVGGIGLGLPKQTNARVRKDTLEEAARDRERLIRENALRSAGAASSGPAIERPTADEGRQITDGSAGAAKSGQEIERPTADEGRQITDGSSAREGSSGAAIERPAADGDTQTTDDVEKKA